jgi:hypothetical protein
MQPRPLRQTLLTATVLFALVVGIVYAVRAVWTPPRLTEREIREAVHVSLQREAGETFYVTGHLDLTATTVVTDTRVLLPDLLGLDLGTTRATVRVPGRVSYGFDVRQLRPEMIDVDVEEKEITIRLPDLSVYSAEPDLAALEVETSTGWARTRATGQEAERLAVRHLGEALRRQGEAHLASSTQPEINTARALEEFLAPVLAALGLPDHRLRFSLGGGVTVEGDR